MQTQGVSAIEFALAASYLENRTALDFALSYYLSLYLVWLESKLRKIMGLDTEEVK